MTADGARGVRRTRARVLRRGPFFAAVPKRLRAAAVYCIINHGAGKGE